MAASTSRQAHEVPLPDSPRGPRPPEQKSNPRKGKARENHAQHSASRGNESARRAESSRRVDRETSEPWDWKALADSEVSRVTPIFTQDGSYFFSLVESCVKVYSSVTGLVVSTLSPRPSELPGGLQERLTGAVLNPHNPFQLITASLNGCIRVWDYVDAVLLQTMDLGQPLYHICAHSQFPDTVFVTAGRPHKKQKQGEDGSVVLRVSLVPTEQTAQSTLQRSSEIIPIGKTRAASGLAISPSGVWLVAVAVNTAYVANTESLKSGFTKYVSPEKLTCLAYHPTEEYFATGDEKGHIRLWYCLSDHAAASQAVGVEKRALSTSMHWHAHAVSCLAFTSNGAYLLSGGEEAVLVIWQLHTARKEFVPRVGAPIYTASILHKKDEGEEYVLGLADGTFVFVSSSSMRISRSYSRIKLDPAIPSETTHSSIPLAYHRLSSTIILPSSHPSSLQTYSPSSSKVVAELEISPSNRVSRRDDKQLQPSRVGQVAIDPSGEWMATVDTRDGDDDFRGETCLKFWRWDRQARSWVLNTRIERPHGLRRVDSISFPPRARGRHFLRLVTVGGDGYVKYWSLRQTSTKDDSEEFWVIHSKFNFRSSGPRHTAWSPDGSLLAVSLTSNVALYDSSTNLLSRTLLPMACKEAHSAHFVGRSGRFLLVRGPKVVVLWDLISERARWHYRSIRAIDHVLPHPSNDTFVLISQGAGSAKTTRIDVFNISSCVPCGIRTLPFRLRGIMPYPPAQPLPSDGHSLIGVTDSWKVVLCGDDVMLPDEEGTSNCKIAADAAPRRTTLFQDIFGKSAFENVADSSMALAAAGPSILAPSNASAATTMLDGAAYLLPPIESLFEPLMETFLKEKRESGPASSAQGPADGGLEDVEMDDAQAEPFISASESGRLVGPEEINELVGLFRRHAVKSVPPPALKHHAHSNGTINGKRKPNGIGHPPAIPQQNGILQTKTVESHAISPAQSSLHYSNPPSSPPPPPMVNGKKRKKSVP